MPQLTHAHLGEHIARIERERDSKVLVMAASHLDIELLPALYDACEEIGRAPRLDVVLHGRGGVVNAARRIALLLRRSADQLSFIVPFHCESAATLLTLCGDEIMAGELALFSPIDPQLDGAGGGSFSGLDIERFGDMAQDWFGIEGDSARAESLALLCNSIFPPSLTAFYRTTRELAAIGEELLAFQRPDLEAGARQAIVRHLMSAYHSHNYAIGPDELARLGLRVRRDQALERLAWPLSKLLQATVGGGVRDSDDDEFNDAVLATRAALRVRRRRPGGLAPLWREERAA
ncbi:hypothetical protein ACFOHT_16725 [Massilia oculi]|jgi:hypothetical protein|uniref:Serine dehydrogenasease n=1 Tax=Massilia oculi TaxID=945844 RepID=A0A2S2DKR3_9BURK|nr:hypothetical protein [Massilia oculi]AWL05436.1 hypothetical protein DIR46_13995 [Massilia oculi]